MKKILAIAALAMVLGVPAAFAGQYGNDDHKGKFFEMSDKNADGVISKDEFVSSHAARFDEMDANGDGKVTAEEAQEFGKKMRDSMREKYKDRKAMREQCNKNGMRSLNE